MLRRLHPVVFWPVTVGVVVATSCYLAAPLHEALMEMGALGRADAVQDRDFLRVFRRLLLFPLLVVFLWRVRPWRGGAIARYGLRPTRARVGLLVRSYLAIVGVLVAVLAWQMLAGWLHWEDPIRVDKVLGRLASYIVGGLFAALLEEGFFRGWFLDRATGDLGSRAAVVVVSLIYALLHAFRPSTLAMHVSHDAAGAFEALGAWFRVAFDVAKFGPAALGLFLFSLLLIAARRRTGTLWMGMGLHAGAVLVLFSYGALTDRAPPRTWAGTRLLYDGPVVWLLAAAGAWWVWPRRASDSPAAAGPPAG